MANRVCVPVRRSKPPVDRADVLKRIARPVSGRTSPTPEMYEFLEAEGIGYTIRLPTNRLLQDRIWLNTNSG
jgi:hypothetical protein